VARRAVERRLEGRRYHYNKGGSPISDDLTKVWEDQRPILLEGLGDGPTPGQLTSLGQKAKHSNRYKRADTCFGI
jgi:hypothetical protein